jgi:hypothetical protein
VTIALQKRGVPLADVDERNDQRAGVSRIGYGECYNDS